MIRVCKWNDHQHYKKAKPPWIKVYRDILGRYDLMYELTPEERWIVVAIWLLAAETGNAIPSDLEFLRDRTRANVTADLIEKLQTLGFIEVGDSYREAIDELYAKTETETETEAEKRQTSPQPREGLDDITLTKIRGLYGWRGTEGTDPVLVKAFDDPDDRDRCLDIAIGRLESEDKEYQSRFFRTILKTVIAEQKDESGGRNWLYEEPETEEVA